MTATATKVTVDLAVPHTTRLRCPDCHRFVGTVGAPRIVDERCDVVYYLLDLPSGYVKVGR